MSLASIIKWNFKAEKRLTVYIGEKINKTPFQFLLYGISNHSWGVKMILH